MLEIEVEPRISYLTAESVSEGHPDKLCDTISDAVLDACLSQDPMSRVACETLATAGKIVVAGEITTNADIDIKEIVKKTVEDIGYGDVPYEIEVLVHTQSPDISEAVTNSLGDDVDTGSVGAGDQGIMYGYATDEAPKFIPLPSYLAHELSKRVTLCRKEGIIEGIKPDVKTQVTVEYQDGTPKRVLAVVVSCQHDADKDLDILRKEIETEVINKIIPARYVCDDTKYYVNPSGRFVLGGFEADTGLTGRKIMVDTYGGMIPHGGGAFSGKDPTKVDRSGAYMARYIAKNIVLAGMAKRCQVALAYAIGKSEPVMIDVNTFDTGIYPDNRISEIVRKYFDTTPTGIIDTLDLRHTQYSKFTNYGHFTYQEAPWEKVDGLFYKDQQIVVTE